jgi:hypothetical protein
MQRSLVPPLAAAGLLVGIGLSIWLAGPPSQLGAQPAAGNRRVAVEVWEPAYTGNLRLPAEDISVAMAGDRDGQPLWLAVDTWVSAFADGVWSPPETPPGVSLIFTLAAAGDSVWAFGLDGGAWLRRAGSWRAVPSPVVADMYDSVALGPQDAWAVGFDYTAEAGVILHATGQGDRAAIEAVTGPWLKYHTLHAIGVDPGGRLWVGGCDYASRPDAKTPFAAYRAPDGSWQPVELPLATGCVYDLAFGSDSAGGTGGGTVGWGLAAAGTDLLRWADPAGGESTATWQAFGLAPPADSQWVRTAALDPAPAPPSGPADSPPPTGWAIAGIPRWNGYSDSRTPWYFDGTGWAEAAVEDPSLGQPGPGVDPGSFLPYIGLSAGGSRIWSITRAKSASSTALDARAVLVELAGGTVRLAHPLLVLGAEGDIAAEGDRQWVGSTQGAAPFLQHGPSGWQAVDTALPRPSDRLAVSRIDIAADGSGWALGTVRGGGGGGGMRREGWRFDGSAWRAAAPPAADRSPVQLRALPGGQAWSAVRGTDGKGTLHAFDGQSWAPLADVPALEPVPTPAAAMPPALQRINYSAVRAPFDAVATGETLFGWLAPGPRTLLRGPGGSFESASPGTRGQIVDLQLTGPRSGWAIGVDARQTGSNIDTPTGVLLRLQDGVWREIPLLAEARGRTLLPGRRITNAHWLLLSAVSADEAWLYGYLETERQEARVLVGVSRIRPQIVLLCTGAVVALSATAATEASGRQVGSDVWLLGDGPCGTPADPRLSPRLPGNTGANPDYAVNHAGPISRVRVRAVVGQVYLPDVRIEGR